jgi:hypothetical protein
MVNALNVLTREVAEWRERWAELANLREIAQINRFSVCWICESKLYNSLFFGNSYLGNNFRISRYPQVAVMFAVSLRSAPREQPECQRSASSSLHPGPTMN